MLVKKIFITTLASSLVSISSLFASNNEDDQRLPSRARPSLITEVVVEYVGDSLTFPPITLELPNLNRGECNASGTRITLPNPINPLEEETAYSESFKIITHWRQSSQPNKNGKIHIGLHQPEGDNEGIRIGYLFVPLGTSREEILQENNWLRQFPGRWARYTTLVNEIPLADQVTNLMKIRFYEDGAFGARIDS